MPLVAGPRTPSPLPELVILRKTQGESEMARLLRKVISNAVQ